MPPVAAPTHPLINKEAAYAEYSLLTGQRRFSMAASAVSADVSAIALLEKPFVALCVVGASAKALAKEDDNSFSIAMHFDFAGEIFTSNDALRKEKNMQESKI